MKTNGIALPYKSEQTKHRLIQNLNSQQRSLLVINRKGHRSKDNLTILLNKFPNDSCIIRFDVNRADHKNPPNYQIIPTPHLHIFSDMYANGTIAIPLHELSDEKIITQLINALKFFMDYTNIYYEDIHFELDKLL